MNMALEGASAGLAVLAALYFRRYLEEMAAGRYGTGLACAYLCVNHAGLSYLLYLASA